jgi:hypothetical protein
MYLRGELRFYVFVLFLAATALALRWLGLVQTP